MYDTFCVKIISIIFNQTFLTADFLSNSIFTVKFFKENCSRNSIIMIDHEKIIFFTKFYTNILIFT